MESVAPPCFACEVGGSSCSTCQHLHGRGLLLRQLLLESLYLLKLTKASMSFSREVENWHWSYYRSWGGLRFASGFAVLWMFLQILNSLLKFRTLLSICLPCCFPDSPLKWFTLSCSSVRIALTLFLLQLQHPASCNAWVDPASTEHPWICLLEQCCLALRFFRDFLIDRIFETRECFSIFIEIISFLFTAVMELSSALFSWFSPLPRPPATASPPLWRILILPLLESSTLQSVQNSHRCPCL